MGDYFLCSKSEVPALVERAKAEAAQILKEFSAFYKTAGTLEIVVEPYQHFRGWSIAGVLTWDGKPIISESSVDLIFLHLNDVMLNRMIQLGFTHGGATHDGE